MDNQSSHVSKRVWARVGLATVIIAGLLAAAAYLGAQVGAAWEEAAAVPPAGQDTRPAAHNTPWVDYYAWDQAPGWS